MDRVIRRVIEMSRVIEGFLSFDKGDQAALIKGVFRVDSNKQIEFRQCISSGRCIRYLHV